jgi:ABC-2 type transport system permease protein
VSFTGFAEYAVLPVAVLGALALTSEYGSGLIRTTFIAVPRRRSVLAAKATVTGAAALVAGELLGRFAAYQLVSLHPGGRLLPPACPWWSSWPGPPPRCWPPRS